MLMPVGTMIVKLAKEEGGGYVVRRTDLPLNPYKFHPLDTPAERIAMQLDRADR